MFWKMKRFSLNVEALVVLVHALVEFVYALHRSDISVESCTFKHMKGPLKVTQKGYATLIRVTWGLKQIQKAGFALL